MKKIIKFFSQCIVNTLNSIYLRHKKKSDKKRLKNDNFTIICNTCIGGAIYHRLNKRFDSPTINLWFSQPDFMKFARNLKEYLNSDFTFGKLREDGKYEGILNGPEGPITIVFTHYDSYEKGVAKWNERKQRIHWDNLYFITSDGNGLTKEDMESFESLKANNKVVFTAKKFDYKSTLQLKGFEKEESAKTHMIKRHKIVCAKYVWEDTFDYVSFLNKK
ncbi:MAG: DUF1919 domain-containing protein [Clostridia bacterium]|nr:DUF1919 domain-containing protein [Clostridia bacterium]